MDSTCSLTVIGTAGLFSFRGTDPVMAAVMMQGCFPRLCIEYVYTNQSLGLWFVVELPVVRAGGVLYCGVHGSTGGGGGGSTIRMIGDRRRRSWDVNDC